MTIDYDHEPIETSVTVAAPKLPEIRSLVLSGVDLSAYQTTVLREAHQRLATRQRGVEMAEVQVQQAVRGYTAALAAKEQRQVDMYWQQQKNRRNVLREGRRMDEHECQCGQMTLVIEVRPTEGFTMPVDYVEFALAPAPYRAVMEEKEQ